MNKLKAIILSILIVVIYLALMWFILGLIDMKNSLIEYDVKKAIAGVGLGIAFTAWYYIVMRASVGYSKDKNDGD